MLVGRRLAGTPRISWPAMRSIPVSGSSRPLIMRSVVDLPQPEGPSNEKKLPAGTAKEMLSTARCSRNRRLIPLSSTSGSPASRDIAWTRSTQLELHLAVPALAPFGCHLSDIGIVQHDRVLREFHVQRWIGKLLR